MRPFIRGSLLLLCAAALCVRARPAPLFNEEERARLVEYWNAPGRYVYGAPADQTAPWQVRATPDASRWFLAYQKALRGPGKTPPNADAAPAPEQTGWEDWVKAKLVHDRWMASQKADAANASLAKRTDSAAQYPPPDPGMMPASLATAAGNAPDFVEPVVPLHYTVKFADDETYDYTDHVAVRERFGYYRFPQGTVAYGTRLSAMPDAELASIFASAMSPSEARVAMAVSKLEGGFEAVNTYDTGYVSVGFIQFITAEDGTGSLAEVLAYMKKFFIVDFLIEFHRFGVDVNEDRVIAVVDPSTGVEVTGADAVLRIIADKRLTAVFQKNGRHSNAFRASQVAVAKAHYWPADDPVTVTVNGKEIIGKVSDVVRSEAGLATLFDRKVNRGSIAPFADVVGKVMTDHKLVSLADAARYERAIIAELKYRVDFLQDPSLSQPAS